MQSDFDELDPTTRQALRGYRVPPPAPFEQMWDAVEQAHFEVERNSPYARWRRQAPVWLAVAATLVLGIGIGRFTVPGDAEHSPATAANPQILAPTDLRTVSMSSPHPQMVETQLEAPYEVATNRYLGEAAALLALLPTPAKAGQTGGRQTNANFEMQANELLLTTRMLLDSPAAADPAMQGLLSDLELVLAQAVSLQPGHNQEQLLLLAEAMKQRDVMPRLENAVVRVSQDF